MHLPASVRPYRSVLGLLLGAGVLLLLGRVSRDAVAAAGFAVLGAAIAQYFDIRKQRAEAGARERQRREDEEKEERKQRREDLDETRRVAYIALHAQLAPRLSPDLLATLVNALAHHGLGIDPKEAADKVADVLLGGTGGGRDWLRDRIKDVDAELARLG